MGRGGCWEGGLGRGVARSGSLRGLVDGKSGVLEIKPLRAPVEERCGERRR